MIRQPQGVNFDAISRSDPDSTAHASSCRIRVFGLRPRSAPVLAAAAATLLLSLLLLPPNGCHGNDLDGGRNAKMSAHGHRRHPRNFRHGAVVPEVAEDDGWSSRNSRHATISEETTTTSGEEEEGGGTRCPVRVRRSISNGAPQDHRLDVRFVETAAVVVNGSAEVTAVPPRTAECGCPTSDEIRCNGGGLHHVPDFDTVDRIFAGLYMDKQDIRELPQAAFGSLKVSDLSECLTGH